MTGSRKSAGRPRRRWWQVYLFSALLAVVAAAVFVFVSGRNVPLLGGGSGRARVCVDPGPTLTDLQTYDRIVGRSVGCVVLYDDSAQTWAQWADPWFISDPESDENWRAFARSGHEIILTVDLFPTETDSTNWRPAGAAGAYVGYAQQLAKNLVAAGMGSAVIRLGHEANGTWYADNVGTTAAQEAQWREFWARTARAMRGVPGAHFSFDWCVAAGVRPIQLAAYYPGNDVVDTIGFDVYDSGVPAGVGDRWRYIYDRPEGVGAIVRFAREHQKPLAIPEWGLQPTSVDGGGGADPGFVRGIARLIRDQPVSFESYFFRLGGQQALVSDPASLRIYRQEIL